MSETVLADAQYSVGRLLRPFSGFDSVYQNQSCKRPIQFTEDGSALADSATSQTATDADPRLIRGTSVPMGSKILLLLPAFVPVPLWQGSVDNDVGFYRYFLIWRYRNISDYRESNIQGGGYHIGNRALGAPDAGSSRFLKIAAFSSSSYASEEPGSPSLARVETAYPLATVDDCIQTIKIKATSQRETNSDESVVYTWPYVPLLPDGTDGRYQQGVISGNESSLNKYTPSWIVHETCARGDELLIGVFRDAPSTNGGALPPTVNSWNFSAGKPDYDLFTFINDSKENGIYLFTGTRS